MAEVIDRAGTPLRIELTEPAAASEPAPPTGPVTPTPTGPATPTGRRSLAAAFTSRRFCVTAEVNPPRGADPTALVRQLASLQDVVDAVNLTDNANSSVRMGSLAASVFALQAGVDPVMQLTCRDRNRLALQSELLSASALGVRNVLLLRGDDPRHGDHPDASPVFDLDSTQLLRAARDMCRAGVLLNGDRLPSAPDLLLGAADDPYGPFRLDDKVAAGADFVQTQLVFDLPGFARYLHRAQEEGLAGRCRVLAGVGLVRSPAVLDRLAALPGVRVPEQVRRRFAGLDGPRAEAAGLQLCAETVRGLRELPALAGVHLMTMGAVSLLPQILAESGLADLAAGRPAR